MIEIDNQTKYVIDEDKILNISRCMTNSYIEIIFTDNETIKEYNSQYRNKDETTDVLSFPIDSDMPNAPLGSVVISLDYAQDVAKKLKHTLDDEISILIIHGILHLLGYDHEVDCGEMRNKEIEWAEKFKLPTTLIKRVI